MSVRGITGFVNESGTQAEIRYENALLIPLSAGGRVEIEFENVDHKNL